MVYVTVCLYLTILLTGVNASLPCKYFCKSCNSIKRMLFLALFEKYLNDPTNKVLVIMRGLPGSGKSTKARLFSFNTKVILFKAAIFNDG